MPPDAVDDGDLFCAAIASQGIGRPAAPPQSSSGCYNAAMDNQPTAIEPPKRTRRRFQFRLRTMV
jgi:hypothetical protein